jgi:hypothetical protein
MTLEGRWSRCGGWSVAWYLPEPEGPVRVRNRVYRESVVVLVRVDTPSDRQRNLLPSPSDFTACTETVVAAIGLVLGPLKGNVMGFRVIG